MDSKGTSLFGSFSRSQISSAIATGVDYVLLFSLVEIFQLWYVLATALGALAGAVTNFAFNRHWSFRATHRQWHAQAVRYSLVSAGSLILNSGGVWMVTEYSGIHYSFSVIGVSIGVGVLFNFPMHRSYVFK